MKPQTLILLLALALGAALAQGDNPLKLVLQQRLVTLVKADGKTTEKLVLDPKNVMPGDVLSQVVTAHNSAGKPLTNVAIRLPVPKNMVYLAPEAGLNVARTEYSIDGGKTFATAPLKRKLTLTENGQSVVKEVEVKPNEYNAVRWIIAELQPGKDQQVGFRLKVQ